MTDQKPGPEPTEEEKEKASRMLWSDECPHRGASMLVRFQAQCVMCIALALAHEREKAAKVAEQWCVGGIAPLVAHVAGEIAAAIRSGGRE